MTITQEELKKLLHYDTETGIFTWIDIKRKKRLIAGSVYNMSNGKKYLIIKFNMLRYGAHRLAWLYVMGKFPDNEIDHIDGNGLNNRIINLRDVTRSENKKNTRLVNTNNSGVCGVFFDKSRNNWRSSITTNGRVITIGRFNNIFDAACARKSAEFVYGFHENHGSIRPL